ncbi:MAG TPA: efflux RND transporter permease subunit, partial [Chloroflexota bacterium]|nr:efflux RND transporter permease subunit [Chloroflexota bacterium]
DSPGRNGRNESGLNELPPEAGHGRQGMWLSDLSIQQPVFVAMLVAAVVLLGLISYSRLPVNLMPDISLQVISIQTTYSGAAPGEIERSVSKPLEDAVISVSGVKNVRSTSSEGSSVVTVEFDTDVDIGTAAEEVRNRVGLVRNSLPADVLDPIIQKTDTSAIPITAFAVADRSGSRSLEELRSFVDNQMKPDMERLEGVGSVMVMGGLVSEIQVQANLDRLQAYGISTQQITQALRAESVDLPAGRVAEGAAQEMLVRTDAKVRSLEQIGEVPVSTPKGAVVRLKDLATISRSHADVRSHSRLDGNDSVMVIVMKQSGSNTVRVAETVQAQLKAVQGLHPEMIFGTIFDQSTFTKEAIHDVQLTLIIGSILAALVVLLFFRDLRNTLVTVAGLPVVLLGTFIVLNAVGVSLNMISMMALSLSVGLLIDDAIVVRENIFRHMETGEAPREAARRGSAEIALAVLAVTSTIIAVFLPIALTSGMVGAFLRDFGLTVTVAVLISLIEAFTLAPMLSAYFFHRMSPEKEAARESGRFLRAFESLNQGYGRLLAWSLLHRRIVVGVGIATLAASLALVPLMRQSFQSTADQGEFAVMMELRPGASLQESDGIARRAEQVLREEPLVANTFTSVGSAGGSANTASIGVKLKQRGHTTELLGRVRGSLTAALPGVKLSYNPQTAAAGAVAVCGL